MKSQPTRDRFLQVAAQLFLKQGYEATGVAEILKATGVGAGSFYYHFAGKRDLLLQVLESYSELLPEVIEKPAARQATDPIDRIFRIIDYYRRYLVENDFELGCPIGNIALEIGNTFPEVRERVSDLFEQWRRMIVRCLEEAADEFPPDLDREAVASFVLTIVEGAIMQSRSAGDIAPFDASVAQLRHHLNQLRVDKEKQIEKGTL